MGQQQLLLLVLGAIIVGVAIAVGINMFSSNAVSAGVDAVTNDCLAIAARAQEWYRKPTQLGGGGHSFTGLTLTKLGYVVNASLELENDNGWYTLDATAGTSFDIVGQTKQRDNNDQQWTVTYSAIDNHTIPTPDLAQVAAR